MPWSTVSTRPPLARWSRSDQRFVLAGMPVEVDAPRGRGGGVERVHERVPVAVVERVREAPVRAHHPAERVSAHLLGCVARVDDRVRNQLACVHVVRANLVARRVDRRRVVDEEDPRAVRRDGVEAEVAVEQDHVRRRSVVRVHDEQARLRAREARARLDQDERAAVGREAARRAVVRDRRDRPHARPGLHAHDLPAAAARGLDDGLVPDRHGEVPDGATRSGDSRRPYVDVQHREPVSDRGGSCERGEDEAGSDGEQHAHATNTRDTAAGGPLDR